MCSNHSKLCCWLSVLLTALLLARPVQSAEPSATQVIDLQSGWNLISIQVGNGLTPAQFQAALGADSSKLRAIWSFGDASIPGSAPWQWKFYRTDAGQPNDLAILTPGKGYWVDVAGFCQATLNGSPWNGSLTIRPGWNLVGFPGARLAENERQEFSAMFGPHFSSVSQVWAWVSSGAQRFTGYDVASIPQVKDLTAAEPGRGYWVYSTAAAAFTLTPQPFLALPADSDASPPQPAEAFSATDPRWLGTNPAKYVGRQVHFRQVTTAGDIRSDVPYDLNGNGLLDDPYTQDTILFEQATDAVPVTIGNAGAGAISWTLENTVPWLFTAPPDEKKWPDNEDRPKTAAGTVSGETDTLILYVDRRGLSSGRKGPQAVTLWAGGVAYPLHMLLDVAAISGDWRGYATTARVGGKAISLGEVRLAMNIFPETGQPLRFRAVLDREKAILFPRDVYMDGLFFSGDEKEFKLTTNFAMPAGDRNAPPYNTFRHTTMADFPGDPAALKKAARGDKDFNSDGKVDAMNPFPFGVRREVTLLGTRVSPNRLEGTYIESIRGLLPPSQGSNVHSDLTRFLDDALLTTSQPVFIEGTFVLERKSFEPTKRSVVNETRNPELSIGGADETFRSTPISVLTPFTVQGVVLTLDMEFPDPGLLRITLVSPNGTTHIVHEYGDTLPQTVTIPATVFGGGPGQGEWRLEVEWDGTTGERGILHDWSLQIEGLATHSASGRIVQQGGGEPLTGVTIRLEGSVLSPPPVTTAADGTFSFPGLTENDYTLFISKPGWQPATVTFFLGEQDYTTGDIALIPLNVPQPRVDAVPLLGFESLAVDFQLLLPPPDPASAYDGATVSWNFGDGSPAVGGPLGDVYAPQHIYQSAGYFTATATVTGAGLAIPVVTSQPILVQRRRADTTAGSTAFQVISSGIPCGSVAARTDATATTPDAAIFSLPAENPATETLEAQQLFQESKWDPASFDLDRFPFMTTPGDFEPEGTDTNFVGAGTGIGPTYIAYNAATGRYIPRSWVSPPDPLYDNTAGYTLYPVPADPARPIRFRMAVALGGTVLAPAASSSGGIVFSAGRTLLPPAHSGQP